MSFEGLEPDITGSDETQDSEPYILEAMKSLTISNDAVASNQKCDALGQFPQLFIQELENPNIEPDFDIEDDSNNEAKPTLSKGESGDRPVEGTTKARWEAGEGIVSKSMLEGGEIPSDKKGEAGERPLSGTKMAGEDGFKRIPDLDQRPSPILPDIEGNGP